MAKEKKKRGKKKKIPEKNIMSIAILFTGIVIWMYGLALAFPHLF